MPGYDALYAMGCIKGFCWEPQEYSKNIIGLYLPGSLYSFMFLLYSWGSLIGVPIRTLLM